AFTRVADERVRWRRGGRSWESRSRIVGWCSCCLTLCRLGGRRRTSGSNGLLYRFHDEHLVRVKDQKRKNDGEEDAFFHQRGTGSCPGTHNGWHRTRRAKARQTPRHTPWSATASAA